MHRGSSRYLHHPHSSSHTRSPPSTIMNSEMMITWTYLCIISEIRNPLLYYLIVYFIVSDILSTPSVSARTFSYYSSHCPGIIFIFFEITQQALIQNNNHGKSGIHSARRNGSLRCDIVSQAPTKDRSRISSQSAGGMVAAIGAYQGTTTGQFGNGQGTPKVSETERNKSSQTGATFRRIECDFSRSNDIDQLRCFSLA